MDIERASEIRSRFILNPVTISIIFIIVLLYGWLDVGQVLPTVTDFERVLATLGGGILYFAGLYFLVPHLLSSKLTGHLPFFWQILLLVILLLVLETLVIFLFLADNKSFASISHYFFTSVFTGMIGVLAFCTIFRTQLERIFDEDPLTTIFCPKRNRDTDPLQDLLPEEVRGRILQMEAQAPYLLVTTLNGSALVRMSIKNAMEYLDGDSGWRVHRSRWVHKSRVAELKRQGKNRLFIDPDGNEFPISRDMEKTLKDYLDFPE